MTKLIGLLTIFIFTLSTQVFAGEFRPISQHEQRVIGLSNEEVQSFNANLEVLNEAEDEMLLELSALDVSPEKRREIVSEFRASIPFLTRSVLDKMGYFLFE